MRSHPLPAKHCSRFPLAAAEVEAVVAVVVVAAEGAEAAAVDHRRLSRSQSKFSLFRTLV